MDKTFISVQDMAEILGVSRQTIYNNDSIELTYDGVLDYASSIIREAEAKKDDILTRLNEYSKVTAPIGYEDFLITEADRDRFLKKVDITDDCWLWKASKAGSGYGQFRFRHKQLGAHRFSWWMYKNKYPDSFVRHTCHNKTCVNPDHLQLGTQQDNMDDLKRHREESGHEYKSTKEEREAINDNYQNGID